MSPEAWAFFSLQSSGIIALIGQLISVKKKVNASDEKLDTTVGNTKAISNGTIPTLLKDVAYIRDTIGNIDTRVTRLENKL